MFGFGGAGSADGIGGGGGGANGFGATAGDGRGIGSDDAGRTGGAGGASLDPAAAPTFPATAGRLGALTADDPNDGAGIDRGRTGAGREGETGAGADDDGIPPNPANASAIGFDAPMLGLAAPGIDPVGRLGSAPAAIVFISVCSTALSGENPPTCVAAALRDSPTSGEIARAPRTRGIRMLST